MRPMATPSILNRGGYRFVALTDLPALRQRLCILGYFGATGGAAPGWQGRRVVFDGQPDERFDERGKLDAGWQA